MRTPLTKRRAVVPCVLAIWAWVAPACPAQAQEAFGPGLRWSGTASGALPAIPRTLAFAADANLVWAGAAGGSTRFSLQSAFETGPNAGAFASSSSTNALGSIAVACADAGDALFSLVQVRSPDSTHRATLVSRTSALASSLSGSLASTWTFDSGLRANGPARLACSAEGARVFVANWNGPTPEVRVDVLDGATGSLLAHTTFFAASLQDLASSADGSRLVLACGLDLWILDAATHVVHQEALTQSSPTVASSGDGSCVAHGGARARVLAARGAGHALALEVSGNPGELASRVALSRDASTLAIGWWNAATVVDARFEVVDVATGTRLFERVLPGVPGGWQNAVEVVALTPDGRRAACGAWGNGTSAADLVVYDRVANAVVLDVDVPGSVFALDLDATGRRVAVGTKSTHANQFGAAGEYRLYDTGEDDVAILHAPRVGSVWTLAARRTGASAVAFLSGPRLSVPVSVPGIGGSLALDRSQLELVRRRADGTGRADLALAIPNDPLQIGTWRHVQAAYFANGAWTFGASVRDVLVH